MPQITALYAGLLGLLLLALSANVVRFRARHKVIFGTGEAPPLERSVRVQANFVEYVPLTLLLILLLELSGWPAAVLHPLGAGLFLGRVLHAVGLTQTHRGSFGRYWGTVLTWAALLVAALLVLATGLGLRG